MKGEVGLVWAKVSAAWWGCGGRRGAGVRAEWCAAMRGRRGDGAVGAAGVFVPHLVTHPEDVVFHRPVAAHAHGQARAGCLGGAPVGDVAGVQRVS